MTDETPNAQRSADSISGLGPPGVLFWCLVSIVVGFSLWLASTYTAWELLLQLPVWLLLGGIWLVRLIERVGTLRPPILFAEWCRWLAVPILMAVAFVAIVADVPWTARYLLSRPAMDDAAAQIMAGEWSHHSSIGLWPTDFWERRPNGMRFLVRDSGLLSQVGFAYSADGSLDGVADPAEAGTYTRLDDHWFMWDDVPEGD